MKAHLYKKIERTAEMIADNIAESRNYASMLEGICKRAETDRAIVLQHSQFFATIKTALWGSLILNIHHCLDGRKEALGFHGLLKQISAFLPDEKGLTKKITQSYNDFRLTEEAQTVLRWRSEMVAHLTHDHQSYCDFHRDVPCEFTDINHVLKECESLLDDCRQTFPYLRIPKVLSFHVQAESAVAAVMDALRMANEPSHHTS